MNYLLLLLGFCFGIVIFDDAWMFVFAKDLLPNFSILQFLIEIALYLVSFVLWGLYTLQRLIYLDIESPIRLLFRLVLSIFFNIVGSFAALIIDLVSFPFQWISEGLQAIGWDYWKFEELGQLISFDYITLTLRIGLHANVLGIAGIKVNVQFSVLGSSAYSAYGYNFDSIGFIGFDVNFIREIVGQSDKFIQVTSSLEKIVVDTFKAIADNNGGAFQIVNELLEATGLDRVIAEAIAGLGFQMKPLVVVN